MREFTKAAISYGWASTCFQMQQLVNVFSIDQETQNSVATNALDAVAESTAEQLGPTLKATYRAGDAMQRGMVNMMFGMAGSWVPGRGTTSAEPPRGATGTPLASGLTSGDRTPRPSWRRPRAPELGQPRLEPVTAGATDSGVAASAGWGPMP